MLIKNKESLIFVQTDKPIYKPGQTGEIHSQDSIKKEAPLPLPDPHSPYDPGSLIVALPTYRTGQGLNKNFSISVNFRVVSLDELFHPLNELVSLLLFT